MEHFQLHFVFRIDPHLNTRILLASGASLHIRTTKCARCEVFEWVPLASFATRQKLLRLILGPDRRRGNCRSCPYLVLFLCLERRGLSALLKTKHTPRRSLKNRFGHGQI